MMDNQQIAGFIAWTGALPVWENWPQTRLSLYPDVTKYFDRLDIESVYLKNLLFKTIAKIVEAGFKSRVRFGSVIEGETICGNVAEITGDRCIRIDAWQLNSLDEDTAMALIAHELAHDHLRHFEIWDHSLENEYEADNLAKEWGFNIDGFRQICGPPGINNRLGRIAVIRRIGICPGDDPLPRAVTNHCLP